MVEVELEDSIIAKRSAHGPDLPVTQSVLRPGHAAVENQARGLEVSESQSLQVLKETTQWGILGRVD